jgi:hypothetical protein
MGQHPSKAAPTPQFQNYPVYISHQGGPIHYMDGYMDGPTDVDQFPPPGHPFPPPPMFINNDFVLPPPRQMNYPPPQPQPASEPPRRGGFDKKSRGQRAPPPSRQNYNPPPRRGRRGDDMDEMNFFRDSDDSDYDENNDFMNLPDFSDLKSTQQNRQQGGGFDPFVENPRLYTREQLENGGAREIIDNVKQRARQGNQNNQTKPMPQQGNARPRRGIGGPRKGQSGNGPQNQAPGQGYPMPMQSQTNGAQQPLQSIMLNFPQDMPPAMSSYQMMAPANCYPQACSVMPQPQGYRFIPA